MKKYLIVVRDKNVLKELNDKIAVDSLFTPGETITESNLKVGSNYTNDIRIYNSAKDFDNNEIKKVIAYDLSEFSVFGAKVVITDNDITVNGFKMSLKYKYGYTIKAYKSYIGTYDVSRLSATLQDDMWQINAKNLITHVQKYGKKVTNN